MTLIDKLYWSTIALLCMAILVSAFREGRKRWKEEGKPNRDLGVF